jgi:hypothetical protein
MSDEELGPDPVVEFYKKDVDRSLLVENLRLTVEQRLERFLRAYRIVQAAREAGERLRGER